MENIARLMAELPSDYEEDCFKTGAIRRQRGVSSPADLMMLAMFHLQNGCSLKEISEVARITKLGRMSDVAFMKRFEKCGGWFICINEKIATGSTINYSKPEWLKNYEVLTVDASVVSEKGRSGRDYRLHYALDIFKMRSYEHKITATETGESLVNFSFKPGHLVIADRAYSTVKGIEHCRENGADYILRLRKNSFTVRGDDGEKIDLTKMLSDLSEGEYLDLAANATNTSGHIVPVRICAMRKTPEAVTETHKKLRRRESKKQIKIADETKTFNEYIVTVTSLSADITAQQVLDSYRLRWQVELYFKRLKSILNFGELPKRRQDSVIAWLNGKLMVALLIELIIAKGSFSPLGTSE